LVRSRSKAATCGQSGRVPEAAVDVMVADTESSEVRQHVEEIRMYRLIVLLISSFLFTAGVTLAAELTSDDLLYLENNEIYVPKDLSSSQMIGLHNVINDPKTKVDPQTRLKNVNHYLDVAMATILACTMNPKHPDCRRCADCKWNRR
jgi:hypothetical protein